MTDALHDKLAEALKDITALVSLRATESTDYKEALSRADEALRAYDAARGGEGPWTCEQKLPDEWESVLLWHGGVWEKAYRDGLGFRLVADSSYLCDLSNNKTWTSLPPAPGDGV